MKLTRAQLERHDPSWASNRQYQSDGDGMLVAAIGAAVLIVASLTLAAMVLG